MPHIIDDEYDLPTAKENDATQALWYVRSKCDPHILIGCKTGDNFLRRDGDLWEWPGYKIIRDPKNGLIERASATGPEDMIRYRPGEGEAAA